MDCYYWQVQNEMFARRGHPLAKEIHAKGIDWTRVARMADIDLQEARSYLEGIMPIPAKFRERLQLAIKILDPETPAKEKVMSWELLHPWLVGLLKGKPGRSSTNGA